MSCLTLRTDDVYIFSSTDFLSWHNFNHVVGLYIVVWLDNYKCSLLTPTCVHYSLYSFVRYCIFGVSYHFGPAFSTHWCRVFRSRIFSRPTDSKIYRRTNTAWRHKQRLCIASLSNKKLSYCWDSSRYDKISDNCNPNRNHEYDLCKFNFANRVVSTCPLMLLLLLLLCPLMSR